MAQLSALPTLEMRLERVQQKLMAARDHGRVVNRMLAARGVRPPGLSHLDRWIAVLTRWLASRRPHRWQDGGGEMKFKSVISRLTGLSTPIFGVSWDPPEAEVDAARRVLAYLEDRRVLYAASELEIPHHCVESVLEIRSFLTTELGRRSLGAEFKESLRAMRAACRKFLATAQELERAIGWSPLSYQGGHYAQWRFDSALGEMRGVFGVHIAQLAAKYGLDVEQELASILPGEDRQTQKRHERGSQSSRGRAN